MSTPQFSLPIYEIYSSPRLSFSGHESFPCRQFWLKKGYDFINEGNQFSDSDAIVKLGVGKNMVASIHYWMKSFGLLNDDSSLTEIAHYIFADDGKDPYLEDIGTLWLLHYLLIATQRASIYNLVFNEFRKDRPEFTRPQLVEYLQRKSKEADIEVKSSTLSTDVSVCIRTYVRPAKRTHSSEDDFLSLFIDLDLVQEIGRPKIDGGDYYRVEHKARENLPTEIVFYVALSQSQDMSISLRRLAADPNNVMSVFALSGDSLQEYAERISAGWPEVTFADDAGIKELQFRKRPAPLTVLDHYYAA